MRRRPRIAGLPRTVERLAQALATPGGPVRQPVSGQQPVPGQPVAKVPEAEAPAPRTGEPVVPVTARNTETFSVGDLQDLVLAGLLRHSGDAAAVTTWLPGSVFTTSPRQWLYQVISDRTAAGQHVDPLIIAWQASSREDVGDPAAAEILRLGNLPAIPGTAAVLGRALLAEHVCTRQSGPDWHKPVPAPQPDTRQAPAGEPGLAPAGELRLEPAGPLPDVVITEDPAPGNQDLVMPPPDRQQPGTHPVPRM